MIGAIKVGTAPGTTTILSGQVDCPTPAAMAYQVQSLGPPTDFSWMKTSPKWRRKWWGGAPDAMPVNEQANMKLLPSPPSMSTSLSPDARVKRAYVPYDDLAKLQGGLGLILSPHGNVSPGPYSEVPDSESNDHYPCGPFDPQYNTHGEPGFYYDTPLGNGFAKHGVVGQALAGPTPPTDLQLSRIYGYTPLVNGWVSGRAINEPGRTWTAAPYVPPNGGGGYGTWGPPLRGASMRTRFRRLFGLGEGEATLPEGGVDPMDSTATSSITDPARASLDMLAKYQDRVFMLSVISTAAIASTALLNILKDRRERRKTAKHHESASPTAPMSGARRRRKRRS